MKKEKIELPLVTVAVIVFNHEKFVKQCLLSILSQTYKNIELMIVDNASIDSSIDVINSIDIDYPVIKIFNDKNIGLPSALNQILENAQGEYLTFVAADDYFSFDKVEYQVNYLMSHKNVYACSGSQIKIDENGFNLCRKEQKNIILEEKIVGYDIFSKPNTLYSPTTMYRKSILLELGGYNPNIMIEDLYMFYRAASRGFLHAQIPKVFSYYRIHGNNSHSRYLWMFENKIKILNEYKCRKEYSQLKKLIYLECFYSLAHKYKLKSIELLPKVVFFLDSKFLYAGILRLLFKW